MATDSQRATVRGRASWHSTSTSSGLNSAPSPHRFVTQQGGVHIRPILGDYYSDPHQHRARASHYRRQEAARPWT